MRNQSYNNWWVRTWDKFSSTRQILQLFTRTSGFFQWPSSEIVVNVCTDRTANAAVHCRQTGVSGCCFTHLERSATSRHFSTISTADFPKKRLKPFLFSRSFPASNLLFRIRSADFILRLAASGLNALFVTSKRRKSRFPEKWRPGLLLMTALTLWMVQCLIFWLWVNDSTKTFGIDSLCRTRNTLPQQQCNTTLPTGSAINRLASRSPLPKQPPRMKCSHSGTCSSFILVFSPRALY